MKKLKQSKYTQQDKTPQNGQNLGMVKIKSENTKGASWSCCPQKHFGGIAYRLCQATTSWRDCISFAYGSYIMEGLHIYNLHIICMWQLHHGGIAYHLHVAATSWRDCISFAYHLHVAATSWRDCISFAYHLHVAATSWKALPWWWWEQKTWWRAAASSTRLEPTPSPWQPKPTTSLCMSWRRVWSTWNTTPYSRTTSQHPSRCARHSLAVQLIVLLGFFFWVLFVWIIILMHMGVQVCVVCALMLYALNFDSMYL